MTTELSSIDISDMPELARIADEVRRTKRPCVLRRGDEEVAVVTPPRRRRRSLKDWRPTEEELKAFRSAAGGWKDMDTDTLVANIYADRRVADRPRVDL